MRKYGIPTIIATGLLALLGGIILLPGGQQGSTEVAEGKKGATSNSNGVIRGLVVHGGLITQISAGLVQPQDIATTTTSGTFGDGSNVPSFTVNSAGQITSATTTPLALPPSGITPGTLSDGSHVPVYTVANTGILTNFVNTPQVIRDQGGQVFNVMADKYGAKGDGSTDDTIAIQSAINDALAVSGTVFFPPPSVPGRYYRITSTLNITGTGVSTSRTVRLVAPVNSLNHGQNILYQGTSNSSVIALWGVADCQFVNIGIAIQPGLSNVVVWDYQFPTGFGNTGGFNRHLKCTTVFNQNNNCIWMRLGQGPAGSNAFDVACQHCLVNDATQNSGTIAVQIGGSQVYSPAFHDCSFNASCNILCGPIASSVSSPLANGDSVINVADTLLFPPTGTISINGNTATYTSKSVQSGPGQLNLASTWSGGSFNGNQISLSVGGQVYFGNCSFKFSGGNLNGNSMGYDVLILCAGYADIANVQCQMASPAQPRRFLQVGNGAASIPVNITLRSIVLKDYAPPTIDSNGIIWLHFNTTLHIKNMQATQGNGVPYSSTVPFISNQGSNPFGNIRIEDSSFFATFPFITNATKQQIHYSGVQLTNSGGGVISIIDDNPFAYVAVTSAYSATTADHMIAASAAGGAFAVTIPAAATVPAGYMYTIKKTDSSGNAVTVTPTGTDKIDGAASYALSAQYKYVKIVCDGVANWEIIGSN